MKKKILFVLPILVSVLPAASAEVWRNHFDADAAARPPAFFQPVVLGVPGNANWMVVSDYNPPSSPNQLTQTIKTRPEGSIAAALRKNAVLENGTLSVSLKKLPSRAGLLFRMANEREFLVLLVDGATGDAWLTAYGDAAPKELARGKGVLDREWGNLKVSLEGGTVSATWNEKELLRGTDPKPVPGGAGVATEGAGFAAFDELVIDDGKP